MSDDVVMEVGKHALSSGGSVGLFALFTRWIEGKRAEEMNTRLALMGQKLDQLVASSAKYEDTGKLAAQLEQRLDALKERLDALVATPPRRRK